MADYDLKTALNRVSAKPSNFVLIKGAKGEQVVVSPQAPSAQVLTPIMEECGKGKRVAEGICMIENDQLVFATKSAPSPAWAAIVTKALKDRQCGQFLPAEWRQIGESPSKESSGEEDGGKAKAPAPKPKPSPPPGADAEAQFTKRYEALQPKIKAAIAAAGPTAADLKVKSSEAGFFAKKKDFVQGTRLLNEIDALLAKSAPAPKPAVDPADLFAQRVQAVLPRIKAAIAGASPSAQDLKLKASEAGVFAKKKDFAQANRLLDEAEALLKKEPPPAPPPPPPPKTPTPKAPPATKKPDAPEAPKAAPTLTTYVKAKREWTAAKAAATKNTAAFKAAILKACDPELESLVKATIDPWQGFDEVLDDGIIQKIDQAIKETDAEAQADHNARIAQALAKIRNDLNKHPFANVVDSNPFGKFFIRAPLEMMLTKLEASFAG